MGSFEKATVGGEAVTLANVFRDPFERRFRGIGQRRPGECPTRSLQSSPLAHLIGI